MSRNDSSAFSAASALVAFESLTNRTGPRRPTCSMRWARPRKAFEVRARPRRAPTPSARAAAKAKAAFWPLCAPRKPGQPAGRRTARARRAPERIGRRTRTSARGESSPRYRDDLRRFRLRPRSEARGDGSARLVVDADQGASSELRDQPLLDRGVALQIAVTVEMVGRQVDQQRRRSARATARDRSGRTSTRSHGRALRPAAADRGSARRCCRPSRRRGRPAAGHARSAPSSSTCRWCR